MFYSYIRSYLGYIELLHRPANNHVAFTIRGCFLLFTKIDPNCTRQLNSEAERTSKSNVIPPTNMLIAMSLHDNGIEAVNRH